MFASAARAGEGVAVVVVVVVTVTHEMLSAWHLGLNGVIVPELNEVAEVGAGAGAEAAP